MLPFPFDVIFIVGWLMVGIGLTLTAVHWVRRRPHRHEWELSPDPAIFEDGLERRRCVKCGWVERAERIEAMWAKPWSPTVNLTNSVKISAALLEQRLKESKKRDG